MEPTAACTYMYTHNVKLHSLNSLMEKRCFHVLNNIHASLKFLSMHKNSKC